MSSSKAREGIERNPQVCPFLGLHDDPATTLSYPSSHNHCFHARPALPVKLEFQRTYCLTVSHTSCEEYNLKQDSPLPPALRFKSGTGLRDLFGKARVWLLFFVFIIVVLIGWQVLSRGLLGLSIPTQSLRVTVPVLPADVGYLTPSISPSEMPDTPPPTLSATATPTILIQTFAPTEASPHALETPIGVEHKLVHLGANGE